MLLEQDHHLFTTRSTVPHCAANAKARPSSPLLCTGSAKGGKAWAVAECRLYQCQSPQTALQRTSESKVLQRTRHRASFNREISFLVTNLGTLAKQTGPLRATADPRSKCRTATFSNDTSGRLSYQRSLSCAMSTIKQGNTFFSDSFAALLKSGLESTSPIWTQFHHDNSETGKKQTNKKKPAFSTT